MMGQSNTLTPLPKYNAGWLALQPPSRQQEFLKSLSPTETQALLFDWQFWARSAQLAPPGNWQTWLVLAGRGFGKTRTGAEWVRAEVESGRRKRLALVAATSADARDVMVEGESGVMAISPPWFRPKYEPSKRRLTWPNGAIATLYSAEEPERLRGPQSDGAWCDEIASWVYPDTWDMLQFGLRLGDAPQCVVTGTPKPTALLKSIVADPDTTTTGGSTFDNAANLAAGFLKKVSRKYEGTRLGRQEIYAEILDDVEGALWLSALIEAQRIRVQDHDVDRPEKIAKLLEKMQRLVVAIDPATTHGEDSDETGICVAGIDERLEFYVFHLDGYRLSPNGWARKAVNFYDEFKADRIVAERNQGGEMVESTIRSQRRDVSLTTVHAKRGKVTRAEPVAALYEQGRVHHVGTFARAEQQMCAFPIANEGDDMVDALVYALTDLMEHGDNRAEHGTTIW